MTNIHSHDDQKAPDPTLEQLSSNVYAYVQLDGSWGLNNTGFIVGKTGITVIDTCFTEKRTKAFIESITKVSNLPIRTLVNTHQHGDHTNGNYQLANATIIGHELCRKEMLEINVPTVNPNPMYSGVEWGDLTLSPPFVTFEKDLTLYSDNTKIELHYMGPAHTTNDVIAWIPEQSILFSGDLLFNGGTPFVMMGSVEGSLRSLTQLKKFPSQTIVPGHGRICDSQVIQDMENYLKFIQHIAKDGFSKGLSPLETALSTDLDTFSEWHDKERIVGNLHRAYSELKGEELGSKIDIKSAVSDMLTYNGGKTVRCIA